MELTRAIIIGKRNNTSERVNDKLLALSYVYRFSSLPGVFDCRQLQRCHDLQTRFVLHAN